MAYAGEDEDDVLVNQVVSLTGTASDADGDTLTCLWTVTSGDPGHVVLTDSGTLQPTFKANAVGVYELTLTVNDNDTSPASTSDSLIIHVYLPNTAPVLASQGVTPGTGYHDTTFTYSVIYSDADNDAPALMTVSIDGGAAQPMNLTGGTDYITGKTYQYTLTGLVKGIPHTFQFSASDGRDPATGDTGVITGPVVNNTPPTAPAASVTPLSPNTNDTLVCTAGGSTDLDSDTISYVYAWLRNDGSTALYLRQPASGRDHQRRYLEVPGQGL